MADPAFSGAGAKPGIEIFRIEKLKPVKQAEDTHGKFYSGDSYIVLHTKQQKGKSALEWDIHFWLGKETSQDESGIAAYKTVELDDMLGGGPVQYREVQDHESQQFLKIFKGGVQYLEGGIESGFRKVERDVYETRLLHIKGRRAARVRRVDCKASSLNHGDVFILDKGLKIFQWNGSEAHRLEKAKGLDVTSAIKNQERGGRAQVIVLEDGKNDNDAEFWEALGDKSQVASASAAGDDVAFEKSAAGKLFVVDDSGNVSETGGQPLKKEMLETDKAYIVDCETELFVWVGKGSSSGARKEAMKNATSFLSANNRPNWTPIARVAEGAETPLFKAKFSNWSAGPIMKTMDMGGAAGANVAKVKQEDIDIAKLHAKKAAEDQAMVDDGTGSVVVYRIEDFKKVQWDQPGQFYAGDAFIVHYTYKVNGRENHLIYFWLGRDSSQDERGAAALLTKELDDSLNGAATQVRVVQNKEPNHFLSLWKGKMVVHVGGRASGFKNVADTDSYDTDGVGLYHVRGTTGVNTRAVQVDEKAANLNSGDAFVLVTPQTQFVWFGNGSNADEKSNAQSIAELLKGSRAQQLVEEGTESDDFWGFLGGKAEYPNSPAFADEPREARLFQCSNATGAFRVEEIGGFAQDDLDNDDVMLLDTFNEVFVWVGAKSNETERKMALETAIEFVKSASDGRDPDTPIYRVSAGNEPPNFTAQFLGWDPALASSLEDPYERKMRELGAQSGAQAGGAAAAPAPVSAQDALAEYSKKYSYEDLKNRTIPSTVDQTKLEEYLEDADFATIFKMSRDEFSKLPGWKKQNKKKEAKLF